MTKHYAEIIKDNADDFTDAEQLTDFLDNYIDQNKNNVADQEDNISEYADGLVPIYYADIVKEWQERNGDARGLAHDQGMDEGSEGDAYKLMSMDLYCLYEQELRADYEKLIELMDEQEDEDDETDDEAETKKEMAIEAGLTEDEAEATIEDLKN